MTRLLNSSGVPFEDMQLPDHVRDMPDQGQGSLVNMTHGGVSFRIPQLQVPRPLMLDIQANPHLLPRLYKSVATAVSLSLNHPLTRPLVLSEQIVKDRVQTCYDMLVTLRRDLKWSLIKCFDALPQQLAQSIVQAKRAEDLAERNMPGTAWAKGSQPEAVEVPVKDDGPTVVDTEDPPEEYDVEPHDEPEDDE